MLVHPFPGIVPRNTVDPIFLPSFLQPPRACLLHSAFNVNIRASCRRKARRNDGQLAQHGTRLDSTGSIEQQTSKQHRPIYLSFANDSNLPPSTRTRAGVNELEDFTRCLSRSSMCRAQSLT